MSQKIKSPKPEFILEAQNICKSYYGEKVIDNVSLNIEKGQIITIIGPNGGGKSSLAKILVGIIKPTSGTIKRQKNLRIGYMPQKLQINSSMPIDVATFLKLHINLKVTSQEVELVAEQVGITKILNSSMHEISGGQAQLVMLARSLLTRPDLLILDEPEQNVDINGQAEIYSLLQNLNTKQKIAILLISHDLYLVMRSSNHVICLNHHICCEGKPESLSKEKAYLDLFGKEIASNLAIYPHNHNHKHDICDH